MKRKPNIIRFLLRTLVCVALVCVGAGAHAGSIDPSTGQIVDLPPAHISEVTLETSAEGKIIANHNGKRYELVELAEAGTTTTRNRYKEFGEVFGTPEEGNTPSVSFYFKSFDDAKMPSGSVGTAYLEGESLTFVLNIPEELKSLGISYEIYAQTVKAFRGRFSKAEAFLIDDNIEAFSNAYKASKLPPGKDRDWEAAKATPSYKAATGSGFELEKVSPPVVWKDGEVVSVTLYYNYIGK